MTAHSSFETWHEYFEKGREQQLLSAHLTLKDKNNMCHSHRADMLAGICLPTYYSGILCEEQTKGGIPSKNPRQPQVPRHYRLDNSSLPALQILR